MWSVTHSFVVHGSSQGVLTHIAPRRAAHGREYVYATPHRAIALLFLCRCNDFLLTLGTACCGDKLCITLTERCLGAFDEIYGVKTGYIYTLSGDNFHAIDGGWEHEVVSEAPSVSLDCETVVDVLNAIERCDDVTLHRYPHRPHNIPADDGDMVDKAVQLYKMSGDIHNAGYCAKRFPALAVKLEERFQREFGKGFVT